jgi:hypothetical protein
MRPSYFDPTTQPDTETGYRLGGKVNKMQKFSVAKKMPRKFQAGGKATAPEKITPEMRAKMKAEADAAKTDANQTGAMNKFYDDKTRLGPIKKAKGGSIRKFADGGETNPDKDVDVRMDYGIDSDNSPLKKISDVSGSRFGSDVYARAQKFLEAGKKGNDVAAASASYKQGPKKPMSDKAETKSSYNQAKQNPSRSEIKPTAVSAPKKEAPRFTAEGEMNSNVRQEAPRKRGMYERGAGPMLPEPLDSGKQPSGPTAPEKARAKRLNDEAEARVAAAKNRKYANSPVTKAKDEYEGMSPSEASYARGDNLKKMLGLKKGGAVKKFAKGGMARGYGVSKVTNKTKYC